MSAKNALRPSAPSRSMSMFAAVLSLSVTMISRSLWMLTEVPLRSARRCPEPRALSEALRVRVSSRASRPSSTALKQAAMIGTLTMLAEGKSRSSLRRISRPDVRSLMTRPTTPWNSPSTRFTFFSRDAQRTVSRPGVRIAAVARREPGGAWAASAAARASRPNSVVIAVFLMVKDRSSILAGGKQPGKPAPQDPAGAGSFYRPGRGVGFFSFEHPDGPEPDPQDEERREEPQRMGEGQKVEQAVTDPGEPQPDHGRNKDRLPRQEGA